MLVLAGILKAGGESVQVQLKIYLKYKHLYINRNIVVYLICKNNIIVNYKYEFKFT